MKTENATAGQFDVKNLKEEPGKISGPDIDINEGPMEADPDKPYEIMDTDTVEMRMWKEAQNREIEKRLEAKRNFAIPEEARKFTPANDMILVLPSEAQKVSKLLIIPDTVKEKPNQGTIVRISKNCSQNFRDDFHVNDKIIFGKYAGLPIHFDGVEFLLMRELDVLGAF